MTFGDFANRFKPVLDAFEAKKFPSVVMQRMHERLKHLEAPEMTELCNLILDNCEYAPKTSKVVEFANIVLNRTRSKGFEIPKKVEVFCDFCHDLRYVKVTDNQNSEESLMYCECTETAKDAIDFESVRDPKTGRITNEVRPRLPVWTRAIAPIYRREQCPLAWFKREIAVIGETRELKFADFNEAVEQWRNRLNAAQKYWQDKRARAGA